MRDDDDDESYSAFSSCHDFSAMISASRARGEPHQINSRGLMCANDHVSHPRARLEEEEEAETEGAKMDPSLTFELGVPLDLILQYAVHPAAAAMETSSKWGMRRPQEGAKRSRRPRDKCQQSSFPRL